MSLLVVLAVGGGGLLGAPCRYTVDRLVADRYELDFPLGTFVVNMSGSFLLGLLTGIALTAGMPAALKAFAGTGFCGAYTTFSSWSFETVELIEQGEYAGAAMNAALSVAVGLVAAGAGMGLGLLA